MRMSIRFFSDSPHPLSAGEGALTSPKAPFFQKKGDATAPLVALSLGYSGIHKPSYLFLWLTPLLFFHCFGLLFIFVMRSAFTRFYHYSDSLFLSSLLRLGFAIAGISLFACIFLGYGLPLLCLCLVSSLVMACLSFAYVLILPWIWLASLLLMTCFFLGYGLPLLCLCLVSSLVMACLSFTYGFSPPYFWFELS